jgi:hypothetical protein
MKINWGYRIVLLYVGFVALIAVLVIGSMRQKIDLVADDYYEQELQYQDRIEQINNTATLEQDLEIKITDDELIITYPEAVLPGSIEGDLTLFRPSDKTLDRNFLITTNEQNEQAIHLEELESGMYRLKAEFTLNDKKCYSEKVVVIP